MPTQTSLAVILFAAISFIASEAIAASRLKFDLRATVRPSCQVLTVEDSIGAQGFTSTIGVACNVERFTLEFGARDVASARALSQGAAVTWAQNAVEVNLVRPGRHMFEIVSPSRSTRSVIRLAF